MQKFLQLALREAQTHKFDPLLICRLCAVIVRGGNVLSVGYNKTSRNSYVQSLAQYDTTCKGFINTHAEVDAILQVRSKIDLTGCKIYVARPKLFGDTMGLAKPCEICQNALYRYGIKRAYYTINSQSYGCMTIKSQGVTTEKVCCVGK